MKYVLLALPYISAAIVESYYGIHGGATWWIGAIICLSVLIGKCLQEKIMGEFLQCPFCGHTNVSNTVPNDAQRAYVLCLGCGAQGPVGSDAQKAWNNRHPDPVRPSPPVVDNTMGRIPAKSDTLRK